MKIDVYSHILPMRYKEALLKYNFPEKRAIETVPMLFDIETRFRGMEKYDDLMQILTLAFPAIEDITEPAVSVELAKMANDGLAELVARYPDKFAGAVAYLPMNDIDAALKEADRAIDELKLRGVMIYTPIVDKPPDSPEFIPLYEKMARYNLPIWIHPKRSADIADYGAINKSMYRIHHIFGWPYDTTVFMTHMVFSGIFDKLPNLKFVTHHAGGMIPFFGQRVKSSYDKVEMVMGEQYMHTPRLMRPPLDYFKLFFYNDTALYGNTPGLMCAQAFFGADHLLFGTDMPLGDSQRGFRNTKLTIDAIEQMSISDIDKNKIFEENAKQLLRLPL